MIVEDSYTRFASGIVEKRRNRQNLGLYELHDARIHPDYAEEEGGRWVTFCVGHGTFCQHQTRRLASAFLAVPADWCEECR